MSHSSCESPEVSGFERTCTPDSVNLNRQSSPARILHFTRSTNAIPIRAQRSPDPRQPLPLFPAKVNPIPCKAIQQARDASRRRRQVCA